MRRLKCEEKGDKLLKAIIIGLNKHFAFLGFKLERKFRLIREE